MTATEIRPEPRPAGPTTRPLDERVNKRSSIPFIALHFIPLLVIWTGISRTAVLLFLVTYLGRMFLITAGYHRYFSHRSYRMARFPQFLMAFGCTMAAQKGPLWWAGNHRVHHRYADTENDLHSPMRGFWWSQVGWILCDKYGATRYDEIKDFAKYPELRFLNKYDWIGPWSLGRRVLLDRRMERARRRVLRIHDPVVAHDVLRELARARLRPACLRDGRHEPELDVDRAHHRRRGLAQQPPPVPVVRAAGLSLVADRHDVLRVEGAAGARDRPRPAEAAGARARRSAPRPAAPWPEPLGSGWYVRRIMSSPVRIVFLGGLGEIGRNCFCLEVDDRILVVDCGIMFPDADMPGVDLVLPDFTYLRENADRVDGVLLTHAHEDHAGGLAFLLRDISVPIYGSQLSLALARNRIEEAGMLDRTELIPVHDGERRNIGPFDCQFIPVTHSVPHGFATAFFTPAGTIIHTGDFKLDLTPVDGRRTDLALLGELARRDGGVRLLLSDSTNAERPGVHAVGVDGRRDDAGAVPRVPRQALHRHELRVAPAPRAAGRAGRDRARAHDRVRRPFDGAQRRR